MYDEHLSQIFDAYDRGRLSRRHLFAFIAGVATAAATHPAAGAAFAQDSQKHKTSDDRRRDKSGGGSGGGSGGCSGDRSGGRSLTFTATDVNHIALRVADLDRSREWYQKHLGLKVASQSRSTCFLRCSKQNFLALFRAGEASLDHYCFGIENFQPDEAVRKLKAAGLDPRRRGNRVYFDDPDGIEVQIAATDHDV